MNETTNGNWQVEASGNDFAIYANFTSNKKRLAVVSGNRKLETSHNDGECNAKLMCAAPDLLKALEMFVKQYEGGSDRELRPEMVAARKAISKAFSGH